MEQWVTWIIQTLTVVAIGILGYFVKRTITQNDVIQKEQQKRIEKLEDKFNEHISSLPMMYTLRDDFIRTVASFENKLDRIIEKLGRSTDGK